MDKRVFTEKELEEMGRLTMDLITEAIDADDKQKAKKLTKRMYGEFSYMHDLLMDMVTALMSYIYENHGEKDFYPAIRKAVEAYLKPQSEALVKAEFRRRVEMFVAGIRGHLQPMVLKEDDEKVCIKATPCGGGELQIKKGGYGPPRNYAVIQKPHVVTYGMTDFPIYCTHNPIQAELLIEWYGAPPFVTYPADKMAAEGCTFCLYKDQNNIPEEVYKKVGKEKPEDL